MGGGLLKERMKPAWILGFMYVYCKLFPDLFPGLIVDTLSYRIACNRLIAASRDMSVGGQLSTQCGLPSIQTP
jgi:hypothetical protein